MADFFTLNRELPVDCLRRLGPMTTQEIASRFAISLNTATELMSGLEEMGHVERAWRIGPLQRE